MKQNWKPGTVLYPLPAVLVSCGATPDEYNLLTVAWTGTVCSDPPMCYISVRPERHSYAIIRRTGGLKDSVFDASLGGNGFTFDNYNAHEMLAAIERAVALYKDKKAWKTLLVRTLDCDFSWDASAVQYMEMYNELIR